MYTMKHHYLQRWASYCKIMVSKETSPSCSLELFTSASLLPICEHESKPRNCQAPMYRKEIRYSLGFKSRGHLCFYSHHERASLLMELRVDLEVVQNCFLQASIFFSLPPFNCEGVWEVFVGFQKAQGVGVRLRHSAGSYPKPRRSNSLRPDLSDLGKVQSCKTRHFSLSRKSGALPYSRAR